MALSMKVETFAADLRLIPVPRPSGPVADLIPQCDVIGPPIWPIIIKQEPTEDSSSSDINNASDFPVPSCSDIPELKLADTGQEVRTEESPTSRELTTGLNESSGFNNSWQIYRDGQPVGHILEASDDRECARSRGDITDKHREMHRQKQYGKMPYKCSVCEFKGTTQKALTTHTRTHTRDGQYKCQLCEQTYKRQQGLTNHMRKHTGEKVKPIKRVWYKHGNKLILTVQRRNTGEKGTTVGDSECKMIRDLLRPPRSQRGLLRHRKTHTREKPWKCSECDYRCSQRCMLKRHMRSHTGEKPFACQVCEYRGADQSSLTKHNITHTGEKPFKCPLCDSRFGRQGHLRIHLRTHTAEKPFVCPWCDKRFSQHGGLSAHKRTHTGEKPFKCTVCEYKCTQRDTMNTHLRTHTGEKPYSCSKCEYRSTGRSEMYRHLRTHDAVKPFKCAVCEYRCSRQYNLNTHMRSHTGEKPFSCSHCEYRCAGQRDMHRHKKAHLGEKQSNEAKSG